MKLALICLGLFALALVPLVEHDEARLHNQPYAVDTTWDVLCAFVLEDRTDETPYTHRFQCTDYAVMLHNNAERMGIRAEYLSLPYMDHALNAFHTVDRGWVYIDCTMHDWLVASLEPYMVTLLS